VYYHGEKMREYGAERLDGCSDAELPGLWDSRGAWVGLSSGAFRADDGAAVVCHADRYQGTVWGARQKITVKEFIDASTLNGAYATSRAYQRADRAWAVGGSGGAGEGSDDGGSVYARVVRLNGRWWAGSGLRVVGPLPTDGSRTLGQFSMIHIDGRSLSRELRSQIAMLVSGSPSIRMRSARFAYFDRTGIMFNFIARAETMLLTESLRAGVMPACT